MATESQIQMCKKILVEEFDQDEEIAEKGLLSTFQKIEELMKKNLSGSEWFDELFKKSGYDPEKLNSCKDKIFSSSLDKSFEDCFRYGARLAIECKLWESLRQISQLKRYSTKVRHGTSVGRV